MKIFTSFKLILIISVLGILLSTMLSGVYFNFSSWEPDTVSYLFQAKIFARGKISIEEPPEFGFSSSPNINILNGKWYSKYPPGNALMLTFGELIGAPWLIPVLATGFTLLLLYMFVREAYGNIAGLTAVIGFISPATLCIGSSWFSEPVSRFYLASYIFTLIRTLNGGGWIYPMLSGFTLGYAFNTRPLEAVAFGIAGAGLTLYTIGGLDQKLALLKRFGGFVLPFVLMLGVWMSWNAYFTGNPLKSTHNAAQPYDKIGFGKRALGYEPDLAKASVFTPKKSVLRIFAHTLPCISYNTLGWGKYSPGMAKEAYGFMKSLVSGRGIRSLVDENGTKSIMDWKNCRHRILLLSLSLIPLAFPLILMILPVVHKSRNRYDWFFLSFVFLMLLFHSFFYFDGSTWGFTPHNSRYYSSCILLGIIPLISRGMYICFNRLRRCRTKFPLMFVSMVLLLFIVNTIYSYVRYAEPYQNRADVYQKLPRLVKQENIHHSVIFIPRNDGAPIGDFPFQTLDEADIVYFKLGPSKAWRLTNRDWHQVYKKYFNGRRAYIYQNKRLVLLPNLVQE